jgi:hypothetical protein
MNTYYRDPFTDAIEVAPIVEQPPRIFEADPDLEHQFRTLARKEEEIAKQVNAEYAQFRTPGFRALAFRHADEAVRFHKLAEEQHQMHKPTPHQIPDTHISRGLEQTTIALLCLVAALGLLGWLLVRIGVL